MKLKVLVTALALFASTAMANAADSAWFSLNAAPLGVTAVGGGPGQTLVIEKPEGPGSTTLTIGFNISVGQQFGLTGFLSSWGFQLNPIAADNGQVLKFAAPNFGAGSGGTYDTPLPTDAAGGGGFGAGASDIANTGGSGLVFEFDLTINKPNPGQPATVDVFGDFRATFNSTGFAWYGNFGAVPNVYGRGPGYGFGNNPNIGSLPVITINNVPEPATIALLGMGVVALLRRRR